MKVTENNCEALKNSDLPIFIWGGGQKEQKWFWNIWKVKI